MNVTARALWYIESHLSGDLSLEAIAEAIGVSRFHLSRAFGVSTGWALAAYVRGRRLSAAAQTLRNGAPDILATALEAGYGSHEAFTRAFRQQFALAPEQVRRMGAAAILPLLEPIGMNVDPPSLTLAPPELATHGPLLIFGLSERYRESNAGIPSQWDRFAPHLGHLPNQVGPVAYGVICNTDEAGSWEYIAGVEVSEFPTHPVEFARLRIPAQTYLVWTHREHISSIVAAWKAVWNVALAASGRKVADGPAFERYGPEFDGRTGQGGYQLWVPVIP